MKKMTPQHIPSLRTQKILGISGRFRPFISNFAELTTKISFTISNKSNYWRWSETLQKEFVDLKKAINNMKPATVLDYKPNFILKTDASNMGSGAVPMQERYDNLCHIQRASRKLTPTESRHSISEKGMLAVYWAIKKFDHDLKGRKFRLITNHRALENLRGNTNLKNYRINR